MASSTPKGTPIYSQFCESNSSDLTGSQGAEVNVSELCSGHLTAKSHNPNREHETQAHTLEYQFIDQFGPSNQIDHIFSLLVKQGNKKNDVELSKDSRNKYIERVEKWTGKVEVERDTGSDSAEIAADNKPTSKDSICNQCKKRFGSHGSEKLLLHYFPNPNCHHRDEDTHRSWRHDLLDLTC